MIYHANNNHKKAGVAMLIGKTDLKTKNTSSDKEAHFIIRR